MKSINIGMVGAHGSGLDIDILCDVYKLRPEYQRIDRKLDFVDLRIGRDFLAEQKKYDTVVLCYIYNQSIEEQRKESLYWLVKDDDYFKVSPLHSKLAWRKRLIETEAKEIFCFGLYDDSEITGNWLGKLDGYEMKIIENESGKIWIYSYK